MIRLLPATSFECTTHIRHIMMQTLFPLFVGRIAQPLSAPAHILPCLTRPSSPLSNHPAPHTFITALHIPHSSPATPPCPPPQTASAVASIAFGDAAAAVDGNVIRVISRLRALKGDPTKNARAIEALAAQLLHPERPGCHNQVMSCGSCLLVELLGIQGSRPRHSSRPRPFHTLPCPAPPYPMLLATLPPSPHPSAMLELSSRRPQSPLPQPCFLNTTPFPTPCCSDTPALFWECPFHVLLHHSPPSHPMLRIPPHPPIRP